MTTKPVAVVSGASSGIGRAVAVALVERGYEVIGTGRHAEAITDRVAGVEYRSLDLGDPASIDAFADALERVDVLVNNAGESQSGPLEELPWDALQRLFDVNVLGHVRLTQRVLPGMRERRYGRIVMVGSMIGSFPIPFRSSYGASKAAIKAFADAMRLEVRPYGIEVCTVEPGSINTGISMRRTKYVADDSVYREGFEAMISALDAAEAVGISAEKVAGVVIRAIEAKRANRLYAVGSNAPIVFALKRLFPAEVTEQVVARKFGVRA